MGIELSPASQQVVLVFAGYLVAVMALGIVSHRYLSKGSFVKEYFLGNRGLGGWVLALTIAATAISGGTFMGFPSLIYTNGWIMAVWIASYMIVPLTTMAMLGKRLNQLGRIAGAVTVPDIFRDRFRSPALGMTSTLIILVCLLFNLVAQFKAGGLVMQTALDLPPAQAKFIDAQVHAEKKELVLQFDVPGRGREIQLIPLPTEKARIVAAQDDSEKREVRVSYQIETDLKRGPRDVVRTIKYPSQKVFFLFASMEKGYFIGLIIFALTVVAYTTYGGFWAVTWTDVFEGLVMLVGVVIMAVLAIRAVPSLEVSPGQQLHGLSAATEHLRRIDPQLVHGPGPNNYLPLALALSFFCMWGLMSPGQPSGMVRLMSFKDTSSLKKAMLLISCYYILVYLSLLIIFVCARSIFPTSFLGEEGSEGQPDRIMPAMVRYLTRDHPWAGGLLLAAPYAAIMSTVAAFLLMISSSLVRDVYQRFISPNAAGRTLKYGSYTVTALVGIGIAIAAMEPPQYLQYLIVFTGSAQGCSFLLPMVLVLYWKRATGAGVMAGMLGGFVAVFGLYALGWIDSASQSSMRAHVEQVSSARAAGQPLPAPPALASWLHANMSWIPGWGERRSSAFNPLFVGGFEPLVWGMLAAFLLGVGVSLLSKPDPELVKKYFPA